MLWLCSFLGTEPALQALFDLEADKRFQPGDAVIHALVVPQMRGEFQLFVLLLITQYEAVIALVGFAHTFSRTTKVLSEKVAPVTAPALPEQIDPASANIETEYIEAPAQLWMSMEAAAFSVFVVDVGVPKLPVTARDHFGKRIEQEDKEVTQRQLELELTETV